MGFTEPKSEFSRDLGKRLRDLCEEVGQRDGYTVEEIASHIGLKRSSFYQYLSGKTEPKAATLRSMAEYFGVTVDSLLGMSELVVEEPDLEDLCAYLGFTNETLNRLDELSDENGGRAPLAVLHETANGYRPALPEADPNAPDYDKRFSALYKVDLNDAFNTILSQKDWERVADDMSAYFILYIFENQLQVILDKYLNWIGENGPSLTLSQSLYLEELAREHAEYLQAVKDRKNYLLFCSEMTLRTTAESYAKSLADGSKMKSLNNKNADLLLQKWLDGAKEAHPAG